MPQLSADQGHIFRSRMLDAFGNLEDNLCILADKLGARIAINSPLSQKLKAIRESDSQLTKNPAKLFGLLDDVSQLAELRAGIVHSKMALARLDKLDVLLFWMIPFSCKSAKVLTFEEFAALIRQVQAAANRVKQMADTPV